MLVIIQARMSSERLPGKMLRMLGNKPLIDHVYDNLQCAEKVRKVVIATSDDESEEPLVDHCMDKNYACFRGSLVNVASRFLQIAEIENADAFVRISGDSPLIDPELVNEMITVYENGESDLVTNVKERTFPKGQSVEICNSSVYSKFYPLFSDQAHFEHVTTYFYENPETIQIRNVSSNEQFQDVNLSVDTTEDLKRLQQLIAASKGNDNWRSNASNYRELFLNE